MNAPNEIQNAASALVEIQRQLEEIQGRLREVLKALPAMGEGGRIVQPKTEWEGRPFDEWLGRAGEQVRGLGVAKIGQLIEQFRTAGDFARARIDAARAGVHLSKLLPPGVGPRMTDRLEQLFVQDFLAANDNASDAPETCPLQARADELIAAEDLHPLTEIWDDGWAAWERGTPIAECPFNDQQAESRDDWLRGWVSCEMAPEA